MITIKLKISNVEGGNYDKFINQYSNVVRYAYNRYQENLKPKEVIALCKTLNNIDLMDATFIEFASSDAQTMIKSDKELGNSKRIFGSRKEFFNRIKHKVSKEEFKTKRNSYIYAIGRAVDKGNRKFALNIIDDKSILFKPNRNEHFKINLAKIPKNHLKMLSRIEILSKNKQAPVTYKLTRDHISITFDEVLTRNEDHNYNFVKNRIMAIDLNPNYVGYSIIDYDNEGNPKILDKSVVSIKKLNDINVKGLPSTDRKKIYITNKRFYEVMEISKFLTEKAKYFHCEIFAMEDLNITAKNHNKGKRFNKLVNNQWIRKDFINNIKKRCNLIGIKSYDISPFYSSFIGQFNNPNDTDSIAASIEINRRAYVFHQTKIKNKEFYSNYIFPKFDKGELSYRWKKYLDHIKLSQSWIDLFKILKTYNECYRFLYEDWREANHIRVCRLKHRKSLITCSC